MAETPKKRGRPAHEPTPQSRKQVEGMAGFGLTHEQIGVIVGIDPATLRLHYADELATGSLKATVAVISNMYKLATTPDARCIPAAKYWLACRAGWSEYAPPPVDKPDKLGKKEQAANASETAAEGTGWGSYVH